MLRLSGFAGAAEEVHHVLDHCLHSEATGHGDIIGEARSYHFIGIVGISGRDTSIAQWLRSRHA